MQRPKQKSPTWLYLPPGPNSENGEAPSGAIELSKENVAHCRALRLKDGDSLMLFDGRGNISVAQLAINQKTFRASIIGGRSLPRPPKLELLVGTVHASKAEVIVRSATELGATDITFAVSEHTEPRLIADLRKKATRLQSIAVSAAEQSETAWVPTLTFLDRLPTSDVKTWIFCERGPDSKDIPRVPPNSVWVGPEGGWSRAEMVHFAGTEAGLHHIPCGVLRVETAAIAALTWAKFELTNRSPKVD